MSIFEISLHDTLSYIKLRGYMYTGCPQNYAGELFIAGDFVLVEPHGEHKLLIWDWNQDTSALLVDYPCEVSQALS